jgi:putative hemagglutination activity domain protein
MKEKNKILRKLTAALLLNVFSFNILADGLQVDPNSRYNTSLDRAQNGVPVVNISTPNGRGVSINEFLEYNVGREGQVLNNADNIGRSHLAGIINANPNLGPNQAANLILLQVNGANRSQIEGYIEALSRQKVNVILSNENGIYLNGAGTINIKNFIPTTGKVKLKDGDVIGIDVEKGRVIIGAGGFDATNTDYVNVIAKAMEMQGNLVGNKVDVTLGENTVDSNGTVASKNGINSVAIDASNLGSMYAGQVRIVSTDRGAGVNSSGLIYSRDAKLEITADGKINVAKIKGDGIEINGTEYAQSELASSDKGINVNASKIKLSGETQANGDINLNGNVENKSNIYTGGNLNTLDMINSGNINASGNITAKDFKNSLATVLSGGNFNVKNLDNSGNIQVSGITDINGKFDNTGALTSVKRISVLGNVSSTGNILTNEDLTAKNTVISGAIAAKNLRVDNLTNDGKISTNGELIAKDVKNTGEILSSGKISGSSLVTSGKVQTNETLDIDGLLDNSGTVGASKDISVAGNVLNSGEILTNGDFSSKNMDTSGTVVSNNLRTGNLKNDGKIVANKDLTAKKVSSTGDITVVGKISADSLKSSGALRTNEDLSINGRFDNDGTVETSKNVAVSGDISNNGKIIAGGNLSGRNTVSAGVISSRNVNVDDLKNDGKITAGENITARKVTNTGDIAAVGTVSSDDMSTSGTVKANKTITVAGKLDNDGAVETAEDVKVSGNIRNTGRIASNGDLTGKDTASSGTIASRNVKVDNLSNDGVIIANGDLKAKNVKNTKDITAVGTVSSDDLVTSGNVRANGKITVSGKLENSGAVETSKNISVAGNIKNDGRIAANDDLAGKNTENNGNIYVKNLEVNNLKNTGKVEGVNLKTDDIANSGDITAIGKISSGNIDNSGKLLANDTISAKNIRNATNSSKIAAGKGITGERIDNSGTFATNGDIKATNSLVNSGTVDGKRIDILGADFVNSGKINADNIKANVTNTRNDGFIYSGNDVDLTTGTLINTKEITAVNNVNATNANVTNSGKIASNNRVLLDNSAITNTGEILSNEILMRNAQRFDNTGTIKGNNVELGVNQNINLTGNLHGQQRLKISANNITNNGNTTGTGLIEINSNDFTNNRELASNTVIVNGRGEVVNNSMITGNNGKISGRNITNNDLVAFENALEMNAQGKVQNNKGKAIYGGQALAIRANEIMNDEAEILGGNMDLNAARITNNVGTVQSTGNITITSNDFQNIGRVSNLGNYEKYYETWDNRRLSEADVLNGWVYHHGDDWDKSSNGSRTRKARHEQREWLETFIRDAGGNSLLLTKYQNDARNALNNGYQRLESESARHPEVALKGKIESRATTEYGKVLASGNITINSANFKNRDSIISGGGLVNITATNFENSVTTGNPVQLKKGKEKLELEIKRYTKRKRPRVKMVAYFHRELTAGDIGYESGQPSVIEGQQVVVSAPNIIRNPIEAGNGKVLNNGGAIGRTLLSSTSVGVNKGTSSANGQVQAAGNTLLSKVNSSFNGNSQINGSSNLNSPINSTFNRAVQIAGNNSGIKDIKNTGIISVNPILASAMFTTNMSPSSKYLMETRSKYINLGQYFGSDYFTSRVGYSEIWDRTRRLGDAYYENQLLTRALSEKLGTAFINGKSNQELIKSMMDNASAEGARLGLTVGQELTQDQINSLNEDIVWYVTKNVNGIEVLAPQVYLSKNTRSIINDDTRNRVGGINGTYIQTNNLVNNGTKYGNGGITVVNANTVRNETATNLLSEISGDRTYINAAGNIENIGGLIGGRDLVSVVSQNGDVINRTTTREVGYNNGEFDRTRFTDVVSVAEISSKNGPTYIQGKNYTSTGAITAGNTVRIDASENVNINALKLTGEQKFGRNGDNYGSYGFVNHLQSAVNGTDGVMITSGKDTNISGSQVASLGNVNINAQNINVTNVVNSESIESKRVNSGFISTETKTKNAYIESSQGSQIFGNNVVLDSKKDTNVIASDITASKDVLGNGGNILVTAGNNVNILSDTTSQSSSLTTSKNKSIGSLNVGSKGRADGMAQVIQNSSHLSANGGNIVVKSGKDTLIGASELQSTESIGLVAGGNVVVTGLDEKYGESSSKSKGGMFRGGHLYKGNSESEKNQSITNKESVIRAGKDIVVKGENIGILGSDLDAGQDINVNAKNGIIVKSRNEVYSSENQKNETKVGFFAKGHNLSFEAGIEAKSKSDASATKQIRPDESTLVANGNINLKSGENIYFEGDAASGQDINLDSKNIFIADSEGRVEYTNESKETRVSFGIDMNFNNIPKTVESFKNYYKGLERLGHLEDLVTPIRKLAKGDDLLGAFHGREKAINGFNDLFAGPTEGSGKAGLYLKASMDRTSSGGNEGTIERTGLTAGNNINIRGTEKVGIRGTDIKSYNDINIQTKNLDIQASKSDITNQNKAYGISGEINALDPSLSVSGYYNRGKTEGYTYNNAKIDAANNLNIQIDNGTIRGANISANNLNVAVKNNLEVESLQDYEKMRQIGINASVGNVTGENKSYGGGVNYTGRDKNWVNEQTSLIGRNSVNVEVGNKLTIAGAKIANEENGIDKGNLIVKANEIEAHDIVSKDNFLALDANANITRRDIINKQKGNKDNNYVVERYENDGGAGFAGSEVEKVSRATIGNGTIVTNQGTVGVNRDISKSDEKTRDVEVKRVGIDYNDERKGWGKVNQIISENAGTLGHFIDAANKKGNGFVDKYIGKPIVDAINRQIKDEDKKIHLTGSYENTFRESTYNTLRTVEDIIDKAGNGTVGLIPTSGMHGGIGEQIPKLFLEDEQKIYKLVVIIKNGEPSYELKEVSRLDSKELLKTGEKVKVFNNGMNETLEKAAMNTAKQYAYGHGDGVYEMALVYNPTRGFLSDALETGLGKVFDGKNAPSLGVSRGFETALRTNDPNQDYELRSYSQGNIILKGGLNNMAKTNDTSLKNFDLSHTATPIMNKTFAEGSYLQSRLGYTNIGSIGNLEDGVTSEKTGMFFGKLTAGLASEMIDVNYDPNKFDSEREALKNGTKGHYTHEFTKKIPGLGEAMGNIEQTPQVKAPLFLLETIDVKTKKEAEKKGYIYIEDNDIKDIYRKQYPNDTKTKDVNKMREILNKEFSRHRIYFDGDFGYKNRLDELEQAKNEALGVKEEDKEKGRKAYRDLIEEQKEVNIQRQNNVIDILKTQRIPRADYDKDLVEQRNNVLKEELKNIDPRNPSLERNGTEIQNFERKNNLQQNNNNNLENVLKNLRERVGK